MKITKQHLELFANLSGDYNPVHLQEEYARQTLFGNQIVYGIYQLMICLEELCKNIRAPIFINTIKADFKKPLPVLQRFKITFEKENGIIKAFLKDVSLYTKITLTYQPCPDTGTPLPVSRFAQKPNISSKNARLNWQESLGFDSGLCQQLFPNCFQNIHTLNLGVFLATTRIIGMKHPGLNSIFNALDLHFQNKQSETIECNVKPKDSVFGECEVELSAPFVAGKLSAFFRPEITFQNSFETLIKKAMKADFSKQRALIVGGSRGIGLQCLRLLALGGAQTMFTYYKSAKEAQKIIQEIKVHGFLTEKLRFDIEHQTNHALQKIRDFAPTHLYYFATPKISTDSKTFNEKLFQTFCHYYIFALHQLILKLKQFGLKNVFAPSSVAITEFPKDMMEYAFAKATMECWGGVMSHDKKIWIYTPRFPRVKTAQTQSLIPVESTDTEEILFPELVKFEKESIYD